MQALIDYVTPIATTVKTGPYADYRAIHGVVCCSYMEMHSDRDNRGDCEDEYFRILPLYVNDCVLIHMQGGEYVRTIPKVGVPIEFNCVKPHGLFPKRMPTKKALTMEYNDGMNTQPVRLVWAWLDENWKIIETYHKEILKMIED